MSQIDQLIRLRKWELDEKRRELTALEEEVASILAEGQMLEQEIIDEQHAADASMEAGFGYANYASNTLRRRADISERLAAARALVEDAREEVTIAFQETKKMEIAKELADAREDAELARKEQAVLDDLSQDIYRRKAEEEKSG